MSIVNEISRINNEVSEQSILIKQIKELLATKAGAPPLILLKII